VALATALSLFGDTSLYAVLPTHITEAGIALGAVGLMLSANRFIRLALNGPIGLLYDRFPRRSLFIPALFIGAASTAIYALSQGFWPLLFGRLLWGLAWSGIWVGGNTIILDVSRAANRGRWVGLYQTAFFLGASTGAILGGLLTDWLGYHAMLGLGAVVTLAGAIIALIFLPETRGLRRAAASPASRPAKARPTAAAISNRPELVAAMGLLGINRLVLAGIFLPTLGLFLQQQLGQGTQLAGQVMGVATLTGLALGANSLISMVSSPLMGGLSDRTGNRWQVAAKGLVPGVAGFALLALGSPLILFLTIPLIAISGGSSQGLATALVGDLSSDQHRGRRLGLLFTVGDLTSAIGPPLAYGLIPWFGLGTIYLLCGALFVVIFLVAMYWARAGKHNSFAI
jgi:MFS family permease